MLYAIIHLHGEGHYALSLVPSLLSCLISADRSYKPSWLFVKTDENPIVRQEHPILFRSCIDFSDINLRSFVPYVCHLLLLTCYRLPYSDFYSL